MCLLKKCSIYFTSLILKWLDSEIKHDMSYYFMLPYSHSVWLTVLIQDPMLKKGVIEWIVLNWISNWITDCRQMRDIKYNTCVTLVKHSSSAPSLLSSRMYRSVRIAQNSCYNPLLYKDSRRIWVRAETLQKSHCSLTAHERASWELCL